MTKKENKVLAAINGAANDINAYLENDTVPFECYQKDIDEKLMALKKEVRGILNSSPERRVKDVTDYPDGAIA